MNEFTQLCDVIPGWAWLLSLVISLPAAFLIPVAVFGWRTLFGTRTQIQLVEVVRKVHVPTGTLWSAETDYLQIPEPGPCPVDTSTHYLTQIYGPGTEAAPPAPVRLLTVTTRLPHPLRPLCAQVLTATCEVRR